MTPLHLAAKQGHLGVLYELKNSVDWKLCSRKTGLTALHVAASYGQTNFVSEMLAQVPAGILSERPLGEPNSDVSITNFEILSIYIFFDFSMKLLHCIWQLKMVTKVLSVF